MSFLQNILPYKNFDFSTLICVRVDGRNVGWTKPDFAAQISAFNDTWLFDGQTLDLNPRYMDFDERTKVVHDTFMAMSAAGILPAMPDYSALGGVDWYPVRESLKHEALLIVTRFYSPYLGVQFESVMLNGYVGDKYWIAKRGAYVHDAPGKKDILTAGSTNWGHSLADTLHDEGYTEAGLSEEQLEQAVPNGELFLYHLTKKGFLKREHFFIYDIDMTGITPKTNIPIEVDGFQLLPIEQVTHMVEETKEFKNEINLVITDFLIRHGYLNDTHPDFTAIRDILYKAE